MPAVVVRGNGARYISSPAGGWSPEMANDEHVARLRRGVDVWNVWRRQNDDPVDLSEADLSRADLIRANFIRANLMGADLTLAKLGWADLRGADLTLAKLDGADLSGADFSRALLDGANLSGADLRRADLRGANLSRALLDGANLSGARLSRAILCGANFARANLTDTSIDGVQWDRAKMRGRCQGIRGLDSCYGNALFKRAAADQDFLDTLEDRWRDSWRKYIFWAWGVFLDYGRSLPRVVFIAFIFAIAFGAIYSLCPDALDYNGRCPTRFTPFYFSIVTYTTLGFGDVKPATLFGEIIVCIEVVLGYTTLGLLLAVLAEKLACRS